MLKSLSANAGDLRGVGSVPESGRSPGEGSGNPLQYSCLENPIEPELFLELEEETEGAPASSLYLAPNSCQGRCLEAFDKHHPCHCNARCPEFGNCCEDFESLCGHGQSPAPFSVALEAGGLSRAMVLQAWPLDQ